MLSIDRIRAKRDSEKKKFIFNQRKSIGQNSKFKKSFPKVICSCNAETKFLYEIVRIRYQQKPSVSLHVVVMPPLVAEAHQRRLVGHHVSAGPLRKPDRKSVV